MNDLNLILAAFFTSCLAGAMGMGGGVLLIALMPGLVPVAAIIPLHAATQLASNASRAYFGRSSIAWHMLPALMLGAALGAWAGAEVYSSLNLRWLPAIIGCIILLLTWLPGSKMRGGGQLGLVALGFYQTGLGMIAGATGPLGAAVLMRTNSEKNWLVVNTAVYMTINHILRVLAFVLLGFSFSDWWELLAGMIMASIAGSWAGTWLRQYMPQVNFSKWFKLLVTLLALRMILLDLMGGNLL